MKTVKIQAEIYSRISGYFRPVQNWNRAKKEEFNDRKFVDVNALQMNKGDAAYSGQ